MIDRAPIERYLPKVILALLIVDGFVTLVLEALYLPTYLGATAFPISAVVAGFVNVGLLLLARTVTDNHMLIGAPLAMWLIGFVAAVSSGPGGDIVLTLDWPTLLLFVLGVFPAAALLYRYSQPPVRA
ncbi:hypothetical protein [Antrihabitans stalactiti]|uniref:Facilitated glucose transporter n=1 Tax=Antrihabitans stalactiti TaxID=2584121 RepID=A0A848KFC2_9NOCA|nr:hypothetical protein [Antrihabitans stalactiti]NMN97663.1 hypothetical protein [Antrihabitans stalactiti]